MRRVLFVCTGNYYRSRYAEVRLQHWAQARSLALRPFSRGLRIDVEQETNVGPMSPFAIERLKERGIDPGPYLWMPRPLGEPDLVEADLTVVLDRQEHTPMMQRQFPQWIERVRFWDVADGTPTPDRHPLAEVDVHLDKLLAELERD